MGGQSQPKLHPSSPAPSSERRGPAGQVSQAPRQAVGQTIQEERKEPYPSYQTGTCTHPRGHSLDGNKEELGAETAPYIDDTIGAALPESALTHYQHLLDLMAQLSLDAAPDKCQGPTTIITWILSSPWQSILSR